MTVEEATESYGGDDLDRLNERISGKEGVVVKCEYDVGSTDYFEIEDNDFPIPERLFYPIVIA